MNKTCLKCRRSLEVTGNYRKVSDYPTVYTATCLCCQAGIKPPKPKAPPKPRKSRKGQPQVGGRKRLILTDEQQKEKNRERNRKKHLRRLAKDPDYVAKRWAKWHESHPEYNQVQKPLSLDRGFDTPIGDFYRITEDAEAINPVEEAEKSEMSEWMEENLTKREWDVIQAFAEHLDNEQAAASLGVSAEKFTLALVSARKKAAEGLTER